MKKLLVFLVLLAGCGYGGSRAYDWVNYEVETPVSTSTQAVPFKITTGESTDQIGADLVQKGLIRDAQVFRYYLRYSGQGANLEAGNYTLKRSMNLREIVASLQHGKVEQVTVTLPEGYPLKQMAPQVEQAGIATAAEYLAAANDPSWSYDFLAGRPAGQSPPLEGYLYPDTYSLNKGSTARDLVKAQLDEFGRVFTPELRAQASQATATRPAESIFNILILASMVEREVNQPGDRSKVCGLYYNRLKIGMALQVDATILYAEGVFKKTVLFEDLKFVSPYNTYLHPGLPPGPIANPGIDAIKACVNPDNNNYLYYFSDSKGVTHFDADFNQFRADQAKFGVFGQ